MTRNLDQPTIFQALAEPAVINYDLLVNLVIEQGPTAEAGRLFKEDGIKLEEVEEIEIEFLNILNISHLWIMRNLVKLKLSNNIIEKIEGLEELLNLKELDLSFNRISIVENLNHLLNLEILLIYGNKIEVVEGIDNLSKLQILSLGKNEIKTQDHVMYLRKLKSLRSLNMEGNPCTEDERYLDYLIAYIPQLIYLQYKMITDDQRRNAIEKYYRIISNLEEEETKEKKKTDAKKVLEEHVAEVSTAYVEYLDGDYLFEQMYQNDNEGKSLMSINKETTAVYEQYKITFSSICHELFDLGLKEQKRRVEEIGLYEETMKRGKNDGRKNAQQLLDEILEKKNEIFAQVLILLEDMVMEQEIKDVHDKMSKLKELSVEFDELISKTWSKLMHGEVILHEQLEDINEMFKINMTDMVGLFLEGAQGHFTEMRNAERDYNENLKGIVTIFMNKFGDESLVPLEYQEICGSKDILNNNFGASHDLHLQIIDGREDVLISRLKGWLEELVERQIQDEKERNRSQILEISHFLDFQREEFNKLQQRQETKMMIKDEENILDVINN